MFNDLFSGFQKLVGSIGDVLSNDVVNVGIQAASSYAEYNSSKAISAARQQELQAKISSDNFNQKIAQQNSDLVGQQTQASLEKADRERRLRLGAAYASGGASGIGIESFGDVLQSSASQEELDLLTIKSEGQLRQREFDMQANLLGMSSQSTQSQIPLVKSAARTSRAASALTGITNSLKSGF